VLASSAKGIDSCPPGDGNIGPVRVASLRLATYGIQDLRVRRRSASISNVKKWRYPPRPSYLAPLLQRVTHVSGHFSTSRSRLFSSWRTSNHHGRSRRERTGAPFRVAPRSALRGLRPIALRRPILDAGPVHGHGRADGVDDARPGFVGVPFVALPLYSVVGSQRPTDITDDAPRRRSAVARGARRGRPPGTNRRRIFIQHHRGRRHVDRG